MLDKKNSYRIGELARELGLSQRAVRYYEEMGLIQPIRTAGGFRLFSSRDLDLLRMVLRFKELGLSLEEIRKLLQHREEGLSPEALHSLKGALDSRRQAFEARIEQYREGIVQIDHALDFLAHCDACGAPSDHKTCHACVQSHGEGVSVLIDPRRA